LTWERCSGGSGEAVAVVKGVSFLSLTALRRSDLLEVFQVAYIPTSVRVSSLAFIEWRDRSPLPRNTWDAPDQGVEGEGDLDSV
jgi:hypothetical protein